MKKKSYVGLAFLFLLLPMAAKSQNIDNFLSQSYEFNRFIKALDSTIMTDSYDVETITVPLIVQMDQLNDVYKSNDREWSEVEQALGALHSAMEWPVSSGFFYEVFHNYSHYPDFFQAYKVTYSKEDNSKSTVYIFFQLVSGYYPRYQVFYNGMKVKEDIISTLLEFRTSPPYEWSSVSYGFKKVNSSSGESKGFSRGGTDEDALGWCQSIDSPVKKHICELLQKIVQP